MNIKAKGFVNTMAYADIPQTSVLHQELQSKQKKGKYFDKKKWYKKYEVNVIVQKQIKKIMNKKKKEAYRGTTCF